MRHKQQIFVTLLPPLLFAAAMLLFFPFRYRFEFDPDEGVNLIKALMEYRGFDLYSQIWSDQPPVFTALLSAVISIAGTNVNAGRLLVMGFSIVILIAAADYLYSFWGVWHSLFGTILIITLPYYTRLSVSVMIGLPSLAFAMMAFVSLTRWHQEQRVFWLIVSGIFLGLSAMIKLWTLFLAPLFIVGIFVQETDLFSGRMNIREGVKPIVLWALGFGLVTGSVLLFMVRLPYITQLVGVHLSAGESEVLQSIAERNTLNSYLDNSIPLFILAFIGVVLSIRKKIWNALYLISWALMAYILLHLTVPSWYHHQLLITIPAAILASIALGEGIGGLIGRIHNSHIRTTNMVLSTVILIVFAILAYQRFPFVIREFGLDLPNFFGPYEASDQPDYEIVALIRKYAKNTHILFTDRPMYAFRSGASIDPYLAVITEKRYATGKPSQEEILSLLEADKPEQIILSRFDIPAAYEYMEIRNFVRVDNSPLARHYILREIYEAPE